MKILVVDDEQDICEILQYNLETEGYEVATANSAEEAMELIGNGQPTADGMPDLILLDVMMGEMSGFQMARKLKQAPRTASIPIIFITALDNEDNIVKGLNIGADDYIPKPLSLREVKARVKAVLRRIGTDRQKDDAVPDTSDKDIINYETLCIDMKSKTTTLDGQELQLTKLEQELLTLLLQNKGKVFSREQLLEKCWPDNIYVLDRTVDVNITRLRKKIGRYGNNIKTRVGYGYYFAQ